MATRTVLALVLAAFAAVGARAQTGPGVGERIRVTTADEVLTGRLVAMQGDTLFVELGPHGPVPRMPYRRVAYDEVESLAVRVPHSRWRGAAIGAGVAASVVAVGTLGLAGYVATTDPEVVWVVPFLGAAALVPAAAVGAVAGGRFPGSRWETTSLGRLSLSPVAPGRGGVLLRVRL